MAAPYFIVPFATGGDQLPDGVPVTLQPDGSISYTLGWGPDYELDDTQPGYKPVGRREMNSMFNAVTSAIGEIQQLGFPVYRPEAAPYQINVVVRHLDNNWRSTVTNNNTVPGADGAGWAVLGSVQAATETVAGIASIATQPETNTGSNDSSFITPLKLKTWFATAITVASETVAGVVRIATQLQTDTGTDDSTAVSPKKLRGGFGAGFAANGYIAFPTWMGGLILQWGRVNVAPETTVTVSFTISFTSQVYISMATVNASSITTSGNYSAYAAVISNSQALISQDVSSTSGASTQQISWFVLGR